MPAGGGIPVRENTVGGLIFESLFLIAFALIAVLGPREFLGYASDLVFSGWLFVSPFDQWLVAFGAGIIAACFVLLPSILVTERIVELVRRARSPKAG